MGITKSRRQEMHTAPERFELNDMFGMYQNGKRCFSCSEIMPDAADDPGVYWAGETTIYLHASCIPRWTETLRRDAANAIAGIDQVEDWKARKRAQRDEAKERAFQHRVRQLFSGPRALRLLMGELGRPDALPTFAETTRLHNLLDALFAIREQELTAFLAPSEDEPDDT
jgi:hypothetical protein